MNTFNIGDILFYSGEGVCQIEDILQKDFFGESKWYYILTPVYHTGCKVFVPVEGTAAERLHTLPEESYVNGLFQIDAGDLWIDNDNQRKLKFRELIDRGTAEDRLQLLLTLWKKENALERVKKHLRSQDDRFRKELEKLVSEELSANCECSPGEMLTKLKENWRL